MRCQPIRPLRGTPGSPKEPIDVGSEHRRRMVEAKERVKHHAFQLPLANDAASLAFDCLVPSVWELGLNPGRVFRILVACSDYATGSRTS